MTSWNWREEACHSVGPGGQLGSTGGYQYWCVSIGRQAQVSRCLLTPMGLAGWVASVEEARSAAASRLYEVRILFHTCNALQFWFWDFLAEMLLDADIVGVHQWFSLQDVLYHFQGVLAIFKTSINDEEF